jgi:DNA-binding transcriptional regulator of glucitol operon
MIGCMKLRFKIKAVRYYISDHELISSRAFLTSAMEVFVCQKCHQTALGVDGLVCVDCRDKVRGPATRTLTRAPAGTQAPDELAV